MTDLTNLIADLSPEQRRLVALLQHAGLDAAAVDQLLPPRPVPQPRRAPLSFAQQRLWLIDQLEQRRALYNMPLAIRAQGQLDHAALVRTFATLVERHEILRTTFGMDDGQPVQIIAPHLELDLPQLDLRGLPPDQRAAEVQHQIRLHASQPFDLQTGPLLRVCLLQLQDDERRLLLTLHHIISDAWSNSVLSREIAALYRAYSRSAPGDLLPPLPLQYADYARWQRERLTGDLLAQQRAYWLQQLADLPLLQLPTDRPRPPLPRHRGATLTCTIARSLVDQLQALARQEGATLFMVLLTGWQIVLQRWSGQDDIAVGTPIANRTHADLEQLIGCFVNTLVLRGDLRGDPSFRTALGRVREVTLRAYHHQDMPFEQLVEALPSVRDPRYPPLVQVMFALQNAPMPALHLPGLVLEALPISHDMARFDLTLSLTETAQGLTGQLSYDVDLFDAATAERLLGHFSTLLAAAVAALDRPISALPLLTVAERQQLLAWNAPSCDDPAQLCLHQLCAIQAARTPDAVALRYGESSLSYRELDRRANQLAQRLQALSGGHPERETIVGVCLERSIELVVALLAVLKAGAAYLPLDPIYPPERRAFMLHDAQAPVLITTSDQLAGLQSLPQTIICLDRDGAALADEPTAAPRSAVTAANLAYVIYTSGSTGQPKGVAVAHANVVRLLTATDAWFGFNQHDVWTLFHSYAFDFSVWELWGALTTGGCLVIVPSLVSRSPAEFVALLRRERVTVLNQTPSAFRQLIPAEAASAGDPLALRAVIFGGEALDPALLADWFARHGDQQPRLINMYGITETTVHVTYQPLSSTDLQRAGSPIGRAIPDLRLYVLDRRLEPAPLGVVGELYVGGAGLARGYLNRPALTAERFQPDPFGDRPGARMYRSGDLARYRPDGTLDYLGRNDNQVKLRGHRIELGEIAAALRQQAGVADAVVLLREDAPGDALLVAYVVAEEWMLSRQPGDREHSGASNGIAEQGNTAAVDPASLRRALATQLPAYMVPAALVLLPALPLTANGKLDQRALPAPDTARPMLDTPFVAPRGPAEQTLAAIWAQVLKRTQIGSQDRFFALGGDSIRAIAVASAAQSAGLPVTVQHLFEHQTIAALAAALEVSPGLEAARVQPAAAPFRLIDPADRALLPAEVADAYPLTQLQQGMMFHSLYQPDAALYHDLFSFHLGGVLDPQQLRHALQELVDRHAILRTTFDLQRYRQPLQLVHRDVVAALDVTDLRALTPAMQATVLAGWSEQERQRAFDLATPLVRYAVHQRSDTTFQFSLRCHHAILDGWSVALLLTELFQRYTARLQRRPLPVTPPAANFGDFVALEQMALRDSEQQAFWRDRLQQHVPLRLPSRASATRLAPEAGEAALSADLTRDLQRLAVALDVPLRSVLLAAHLVVLRLLSGQRAITTGLVTNGRPESEDGDRILGLFLNSVPFQLDVGRHSWRALIQATFAAEQELLPYRRYPLAQIQRDLGAPQLFDVLFTFVHFHVYEQLAEVPGLELIDKHGIARTNFALDVAFSLSPTNGLLTLLISADPRSDMPPAEQLVALYLRVLRQISGEPDGHYRAAQLLPSAEINRLLALRQGQPTPIGQPRCVHQLFEARVASSPTAVALVTETETLSYDELNRRANQLAHALIARGIGGHAQGEPRVGIAVERSVSMIVGLLGVLKAGGAYVPLDPSYPPQRLAAMLREAQISLLLTTRDLLPTLSRDSGAVLLLDDPQSIGRQPWTNPQTTPDLDNLMYVIFTSGSTGQPKGVAITHRNVCNHLHWMQQRFPLGARDGVLQQSSFSFDTSVWEIFAPLVWGARLVQAPAASHGDPAALMRLIAAQHVTTIQVVPSLMRLMVEQPELARCRALRTIFCGGEVLSPELVAQVQSRSDATLVNTYGPTETTIDAAFWECPPACADATIPLGQPIGNGVIMLLDQAGEPVPLGTVGELYVGGAGVARGYLHQPALTAERFVPDAWSERPGARLYRTGDLGRYRADGTIEFLGRADHQIKLHGVRIELQEIERVLQQHPAVQTAVVVLDEDTSGDRRLVAYVVAASSAEQRASSTEEPGAEHTGTQEHRNTRATEPGLDAPVAPTGQPPQSLVPSALRAFLAARLPSSIIPSMFVLLPALPLTPSGKLDRRALPAPRWERVASEPCPPRDDSERRLVELWQQALGISSLGVEDRFLDVGGDSLIAVRLQAQIAQCFGRTLPLTTLVRSPTIAELARQLREPHAAPWTPLVALQAEGSRPPLFLIHPVGGSVLCYAELAAQLGPDQPVYGLQARGLEPDQTPQTTIEALAADYRRALQQQQPQGPYYLGGWSFGGAVAYELARQLWADRQPVAQLILIDSYLAAPDAPAADATTLLLSFLQDRAAQREPTPAPPLAAIDALPLAERRPFVLDWARQQGLVADQVGLDQIERLLAVFEAHVRALLCYQPQPLSVPMLSIQAAASSPGAEAVRWPALSPQFAMLTLPGDHYQLLRAPHVAQLACEISVRLSS